MACSSSRYRYDSKEDEDEEDHRTPIEHKITPIDYRDDIAQQSENVESFQSESVQANEERISELELPA